MWEFGLDLSFPEDEDQSRISQIASILSGIFAIFTTYIVIGGVLTGHTTVLRNASPVIPLAILFILIILIGALEALQISIASLKLRELEGFENEFPRAYEIHSELKAKKEASRDFFAGRQIIIVLLVFLAARVTSFPDMSTFPFTTSPFPSWMNPWFPIIFLKLGLLGAFFVFWLGNLAPQLGADRYPIQFLNFPGMKQLFHLCLFISNIQIPRPSKWIADTFTYNWKNIKPSLSPQELYIWERDEDRGFAISECHKTWEFNQSGYLFSLELAHKEYLEEGLVGEQLIKEFENNNEYLSNKSEVSQEEKGWKIVEGAREYGIEDMGEELSVYNQNENILNYSVSIKIGNEGITAIHDDHLILPNGVNTQSGNWSATLSKDGMSQDVSQYVDLDNQPRDQGRVIHVYVESPRDTFDQGDEVSIQLQYAIDSDPTQFGSDLVEINKATKSLRVDLIFNNYIYNVNPPILEYYEPPYGYHATANISESTWLDEVDDSKEGDIVYTYTESYPRKGSRHVFNWNARQRR